MQTGIFISIKPPYCKLIKSQEKVNEFRSKIPKLPVNHFWIYESAPSSSLKYCAIVGTPVHFPDKVKEVGYGDQSFNEGNSKYTYAYPILQLYELTEAIPLKILKEMYQFSPPQGFAYCGRYPKLDIYLKNHAQWREVF
ncbi:hypothetical protein MKZ08_10675 [Viridibacillus sp. FSL R5-0477]|uniref:ASCH domain-containing protein n=1 Tax=Viridibacillus arenosi FSL R5-213 TaxID=1227360 RepID=W4F269_9BACL|nr:MULTISPECIES: hypothetical protein [Viridibacillus]ETT86549.1 hypothetical protein C176_07542 [Viridibacillus arenosi FSL R5-213]OMC84576.1 hypothetical protein BK130_02835 [Viridibacillus sp. FSL H8-0123]OMC85996.1 hypothetical protein BK128_13270 [Viridibacillus sp. FSL H7-0596]OMC91625.1 hypothetical protein BK137_06795 [Viridibacillus arenosi]